MGNIEYCNGNIRRKRLEISNIQEIEIYEKEHILKKF
jgi:hypothetical protein